MAKGERIEDFGEKIGGARKDMWRDRTLTIQDLDSLSPEEATKFVTKDLIWPAPDYAALVEGGMAPEAAALVKIIRDRMGAKANLRTIDIHTRKPRDGDLIRRDYVNMMSFVRDDLMTCETVEDVSGLQRRVDALLYQGQKDEMRQQIFSVYKGRSTPFAVHYDDREKSQAMVAEGFPGAVPAWRRGVTARTRKGTVILVKAKRVISGRREFETEEAAFAWLEEESTKKPEKGAAADKPTEPKRPHIDALSRDGMPDWRGGADVVPDDFLAKFGFRGVEFGNWLPDAERGKVLNLAYDALCDLAHLMDIPTEALSFGGRLGLAFGSRGSGGAAAHYEPARRVINMTRIKGAGFLAHEFGHAIDHVAGEINRTEPSRGDVRYASGGDIWFKELGKTLHHLPADASAAWVECMNSLRARPRTKAEVIERTQAALTKTREAIEKVGKTLEKHLAEHPGRPGNGAYERQARDWTATQELRVAALEQRLVDVEATSETESFGMGETDFFANAQKLSPKAGGYYVRPCEMFARAFESTIYDRIRETGATSDYLVHGVEGERFSGPKWKGNPYPEGEERKAINATVWRVIETMAPILRAEHDMARSLSA